MKVSKTALGVAALITILILAGYSAKSMAQSLIHKE